MSEVVRGFLSISVRWTCPSCLKTRKHTGHEVEIAEYEDDDGGEWNEFEMPHPLIVHCGPCDKQYEVEFGEDE